MRLRVSCSHVSTARPYLGRHFGSDVGFVWWYQVKFGQGTEDEMCIDFLWYYPKQPIKGTSSLFSYAMSSPGIGYAASVRWPGLTLGQLLRCDGQY